jgi:hypothetical protein
MLMRFSIISILASILSGAVFCLQPTGQVFAMPSADDTNPPQVTPPPEGVRLEKLFQREQNAHDKHRETLNKASKTGEKLSEMITRAKENGKDTRSLEKALADFNNQLGEIRLMYNQTDRLIKQHAGFNDRGKLTDTEKARETVKNVREGNQRFRKSLARVLENAKGALQEYRKANPRPTPTEVDKPV